MKDQTEGDLMMEGRMTMRATDG